MSEYLAVAAIIIMLGVLLYSVTIGFDKECEEQYPSPPDDCPFYRDCSKGARGPMWAGSAAAQAYLEVIGFPADNSLYAYWARRHPHYDRMVAMEKLAMSPAPIGGCV